MPVDKLDFPRYFWQLLNGFRVAHERRLADLRKHDITPWLDLRQPRVVLDLANGRLRPQFAILRAAGHRVCGIDLINRPHKNLTDILYILARRLYAERMGISFSALSGSLLNGDVGRLPFPDQTFELVTSVAAFEHFGDVPLVVSEMDRVLKPGGLAWVCVHPFTTLSGGHNVSLTQIPLRHVPRGIDPWDHLRKRRLPFHVFLNEWRIPQYLACFLWRFEVLKSYCALREGEDLLTPDIARELTDYTREELTSQIYVILARKRNSHA
jgi:SAM-dependent methyltransferase